MGVGGVPEYGGRLDLPMKVGVSEPLEKAPPLQMLTLQIWCLWSNGWCVNTEILQRSLTLRIPRFNVIQGHLTRHGSIGYL